MPLFTKFKKAKDAAIEHKKTAAAEQVISPAPPYKHVPTHAKQDALAMQPTTVRPEELQARIAAARKRRANSYQPPVTSRHSVYHSCESSRASSRTNSTAQFVNMSASASLKGKAKSAESIDTVLRRPHSISNGVTSSMASGPPRPSQFSSAEPGAVLPYPFPGRQRPRPTHTRSRRSSFAKKKSPLSMSVEEEPDELFSSSSNTSAASTQSSATNESRDSSSDDDKVRERATAAAPTHLSVPTPVAKSVLARSASLAPGRSRWSMFQRKSIDISAH
ncbi:hypothetical protein HBI56_174720 [Parastagonospora nodorum]|nr:hypothetical protein HBH51_182610 [Parastagonospora nodorum]KAH3993357.1 hypothetical protein HBI10_202010 [Parastagonospora nodorum]KAH4011744.1 hypothetical protein HBI13_196230 [Parastagonospora nodorum]KAH4024783.1 hypothetical protein HBI09_158330 [Parastagonospora nodorum]KAH4203094.1 hypothetical protein HBI95_154200 [Parastagonospora nodorum]